MELLTNPEAWIALLTLTALEIVLGIDNIIFISILVGKLPSQERNAARKIGLTLAMVTRILLLFSLTWMMRLTSPLFTALNQEISGRDLILLLDGLFLLWKSTMEIHGSLEGEAAVEKSKSAKGKFGSVLFQIAILDLVFSLDSVITAVGMAQQIEVMVAAVVIAVGVMMFASRAIAEFVDRHPTIKVLALAFLVMIGVTLIAEGLGFHIPKGYVYFAMAFSVSVEMINIRTRKKVAPVKLYKTAY
ncbi:MAG TPA: hypothetical protein DCS07_04060 [Bdellovibrionales bacterium]|nr:hypothetical protein [Bdellovibrionales bacterium]